MACIKRWGYIILFLLAACIQPGLAVSATEVRLEKTIQQGAQQDLISISAQNIDINEFLKGVSKTYKVNIITSREVSGNISVNLYNVPLEEVLKAVCLSNGYQWSRQEDIFYIFQAKGNQKNIQDIDTVVKSFRINFADIGEVRNVIEDLLGADSFTVHEEAKTVIVEDSPENVAKIEKILTQIDYAPRQVLIEAKILEIRLGEEVSLGVDWETTFRIDGTQGNISTQGFSLPSNAEGSTGFFFDVVGQDLKVYLDALELRSDINVLATPKLLALDGKEAEIIIGGKLGYYEVTTTETSTLQSVMFLDIGTQLKLTPQISQDGKILMEIHPAVSDGTVDIRGLPSTNTTEVTTSILAEDGDTIFIGGLIREGKEKLKSKVPFLGSVPLVGNFFSRTEDNVFKTEIIILITPYLVSPEHQPIHTAQAETVSRAEQVLDEEESTAEKLFNKNMMYEKISHPEGLDSIIKKHNNIPSGAKAPDNTTDDASGKPIHAAQAETVFRAEQVLDEEESTAEKLFNKNKMYEEIRHPEGLDSVIKKHDNIPSGAKAPDNTTDDASGKPIHAAQAETVSLAEQELDEEESTAEKLFNKNKMYEEIRHPEGLDSVIKKHDNIPSGAKAPDNTTDDTSGKPIHIAQAETVFRAEQELDKEENTAVPAVKKWKNIHQEGLDSVIKKHDNIPSGAMVLDNTTDDASENAPEQAKGTKPEEIIVKVAVPLVEADVPTQREEVKKEAVPVQESTPHPAKTYTILVGTFYTKENAESLQQTLQAKGYPSFVLTDSDSQDKPVSVVKVGPLDSYDTACQYASRFQKEEGTPAVILTKREP